MRILTLCAVAAITTLATPAAQAQAPRGKLEFRRVITRPYIEGSVSFLRVRDGRGTLVVR